MANGNDISRWIPRLREAVRQTDPRAFLVPARIVRRVIKKDRDVPGFGLRVPHRKSYVIPGARLSRFVEKDELGLSIADDYPAHVFLIAEPKESELAGMSEADLWRWTWRLLFHCRIHFEYERLLGEEIITPGDVRSYIDQIGQVEFDEAESVLHREQFVFNRSDRTELFVEFAALYWEYHFFAPERLPWYFPSLTDPERVESVLSVSLDVSPLVDETRLVVSGGSESPFAEPSTTNAKNIPAAEKELENDREPANGRTASPRRFQRLVKAAERAAGRGNSARAALTCSRAAEFGTPEQSHEAQNKTTEHLDTLAARLQKALELNEEETQQWRAILSELLQVSRSGFWNADRRLLYDLQNVCLDHERTVYRIDLLEWLRSAFKRPIKRPLPHQREVLTVKYLRNALKRLKSSKISDAAGEQLSRLLRSSLVAAEHTLRETLREPIRGALADVGVSPANPVEATAFKKLTEELLDGIIKRGYVNMGMLRDAVSRNRIKLDDLSGPWEFLAGDRLLKADQRLSIALDGIYRRGDFYLRWLQRLSSLAFGTKVGRWLTLFVMIPFGGAFMLLHFFGHVIEKIGIHAPLLVSRESVVLGGLFLLGLMHSRVFRNKVFLAVSWLLRALGSVFIDMPIWAIRNPALRRFLRSAPVVFVRRFILLPGVFTLVFCTALPWLGAYGVPSLPWTIAIYLLLTAALNSRMGRDLEEMSADWIDHTWYQIRTRVFVAIFEWVMFVFKAMLGFVERFLYAVDEWLRFRSGESRLTMVAKAVFGVFWAAIAFVATFCITLLIEPQLNPIKHFPVVTVSHKIILPMGLPGGILSGALEPLVGSAEAANAIAGTVVFLIPGIFGFLVWELRANWRLYSANSPDSLQPIIVGDHGETMIRLLKPGFHSGTLPKLYGKIRREVRRKEKSIASPDLPAGPHRERPQHDHETTYHGLTQKYADALHHVEESIRHFIAREFLALLEISGAIEHSEIRIDQIEPTSNSIRVALCRNGSTSGSLVVVFQEQSGRLMTGILQAGWLAGVDAARRNRIGMALAGLYHLSGAELVREQIARCLPTTETPYDVAERSLVVWPAQHYELEVRYELDERPVLTPRPFEVGRQHGLSALPEEQLIYSERTLRWNDWSQFWTDVATNSTADRPATESLLVLPAQATMEISEPTPESAPS